MTRENLTKKEEAQLNSILTKIDRIKADKSRNVAEDTSKVNTAEIKKIQGQI